jgi:acyl-CoA thioesterase
VTDPQTLAESVVARMLDGDAFTRSLGMELLEVAPRRAVLRMSVRPDMVNGFGICHGGVTFSLADSALAFAANSHGTLTVSIENSIGYAAAANVGDVLTARCEAESTGRRVSFYRVAVVNQKGEPVAHFRGTVYDTGRPHL